jgi:hypothetical protein
MIVILHQRSCQTVAETAKSDLLTAFTGHVEVMQVEAETAARWPASEVAWDDLLIIVFDASPFPDAGNQFITQYLKQRGDDALLLPVTLDPAGQRPPKPSEAIKALLYDATAIGDRGRLANRAGGMLGLRVQGRHTKLFISYRAADGTVIAEQLNTHLRGLGYQTFLDQAKEFDGEPTILPGNAVQKEINDALGTANLVLLVDTPKAHESKWIRHEIDTADALLLPVLPICFRDSGDPKKGTRFRPLLALGRWMQYQTPPAGACPLSRDQLSEIVSEAEAYLCEIFRRKCRVPFLVKKEFISHGFAWAVLDQKLLMFESSRTGGRLTTKIVNHCSIFDVIYEPAIRRFEAYLSKAGHANHSLFIYDGVLMPDHEVQELVKGCPDFVVVLHHQELAALIDSHFTMLSAA